MWVHAPTAEEALSLTHAIAGLGGWNTGLDTEALPRSEYAERHHPRDFTALVIRPRDAGAAAG